MGLVQNHLDKFGTAGAALASLCCLGTPALLSLVSAIGLGFLIHDAVLIPLMLVFLALSVFGLYRSFTRHRRPYPLLLGVLSAVGLVTGVLFFYATPAPYISLAALVAASVWNIAVKRACGL